MTDVGYSARDAVMQMAVSKLKGDATFMALVPGGVFDLVPQGVAYPCARVMVREAPGDMETFGALAFHVEQRVRGYVDASQSGNDTSGVDAIINRAVNLLRKGTFSLAGFIVYLVSYSSSLAAIDSPSDFQVTGKRIVQCDAVFDWMVEAE